MITAGPNSGCNVFRNYNVLSISIKDVFYKSPEFNTLCSNLISKRKILSPKCLSENVSQLGAGTVEPISRIFISSGTQALGYI